ncbi:MAG: hypothetical protein R2698_08850 [Microthrixaceae bacterium]
MGTLSLLDPGLLPRAVQAADAALVAVPADPAAVLMRAVWASRDGDVATASKDLGEIGDRVVWAPVARFLDVGSAVAEVKAVESRSATSSVETTSTTSP